MILLFSMVYLKSLFPSASVFVYGDSPIATLAANSSSFDFVFLPHYAMEELELDRLDLAINTVSFMEMTSEQVDSYARKLAELGCQYLYSANRDRAPWNDQLTTVSSILDKYFDLEDLHPAAKVRMSKPKPVINPLRHPRWWLRDQVRRRRMKGAPDEAQVMPKSVGDYRQLLGKLRQAAAVAVAARAIEMVGQGKHAAYINERIASESAPQEALVR